MKTITAFLCFTVLLLAVPGSSEAQTHWVAGGKMGLSLLDGTAGFQIGPMGEVIFNKNLAVGSEFTINTQSGTPVNWANYFKYYFTVPGSKIKPYADAGFSLWFYTGGPYFSILFGGGAQFPVAKNLYIPADLQLGPVFATGTTVFYFAITTGIRYEI
ncbi:MAG TPA: hypothetical protein VFG32_14095 [Bacteroidota bacterium]|nr:hypothetical protein [Bacteroidota bacterium]